MLYTMGCGPAYLELAYIKECLQRCDFKIVAPEISAVLQDQSHIHIVFPFLFRHVNNRYSFQKHLANWCCHERENTSFHIA